MATEKPSEQTWLAEYKAYRDELLELTKQRYYILYIAISALGVFFALVGRADRPDIFLLAPLLIFILVSCFALITFRISEQYHRICAYIEIFVEPNLGLKREIAWDIHHKMFKHISFTRPIMRTYSGLFWASGFLPLAYLFLRNFVGASPQSELAFRIASVEATVGFVLGISTWFGWSSLDIRTDAKKKWEQVKDQLGKNRGVKSV